MVALQKSICLWCLAKASDGCKCRRLQNAFYMNYSETNGSSYGYVRIYVLFKASENMDMNIRQLAKCFQKKKHFYSPFMLYSTAKTTTTKATTTTKGNNIIPKIANDHIRYVHAIEWFQSKCFTDVPTNRSILCIGLITHRCWWNKIPNTLSSYYTLST